MGRLIDTDDLMELLGFENTQEERDENVGEIITFEDIDGLPTAYDVDKVVEQLRNKAIPVEEEDEHMMPESNVSEAYELEVVALSDAIEIVKGGGVDAVN